MIIVLFILAYFGLGFIFFLITKKKKREPIKASDIIDPSVVRDFKLLKKHLSDAVDLMKSMNELDNALNKKSEDNKLILLESEHLKPLNFRTSSMSNDYIEVDAFIKCPNPKCKKDYKISIFGNTKADLICGCGSELIGV